MRVTDILSIKGNAVQSLPPSATIADLIQKLADYGIGAVVVLNGDELVGIVSERDVVRHVDRSGDLSEPVVQIMTEDVATCEPGDQIRELARQMTDRRVRHLPVVQDGKVVGIISIGDVVKARLDDLEAERDHLEGYLNS